MPSLVTRFHLLLFFVTLAITGVAVVRVPADFVVAAHWNGGTPDWLWPRNVALVFAPVIELVLLAGFFVLGRALTKNHMAKTRHILEPALTLPLLVATACQFALLLQGIGSDFDLFRVAACGLAATLAVLAVVIFEAQRVSYGGLRMPWRIASDRAWTVVHRLSGIFCGVAAVTLASLAWTDAGIGPLTMAMAVSLVGLPVFAGLATLLTRRL